jgi:hypothetical protein
MTTTYTIPGRFWEDHVDRGCRCDHACPDQEAHEATGYGEKVRGGYRVTLTDLDAAELLSDARHYAEMGVASYGQEALGLISSARAIVRRLSQKES